MRRTSSPLTCGVAYSVPLVAGRDSTARAPALNRSLGSRLRKRPLMSCANHDGVRLEMASGDFMVFGWQHSRCGKAERAPFTHNKADAVRPPQE